MQGEVYSETSREETAGETSPLTAKLLRKKNCSKETYCENVRRNTNDSVFILIRSNKMQQYAGIYLLQNHSLHVLGVHRSHHGENIKLEMQHLVQVIVYEQ